MAAAASYQLCCVILYRALLHYWRGGSALNLRPEDNVNTESER